MAEENERGDIWRMGRVSFAPDWNIAKTPCNRKQDILSPQEDHRSEFYKHYRREAEEYDREFMEKYDEDLNTTLIFVSSVLYSVQMCVC